MVYSFARVSAVVAMEVTDYFANGKRLRDKGGKRYEMPAHRKLEGYWRTTLRATIPFGAPLMWPLARPVIILGAGQLPSSPRPLLEPTSSTRA
jgi:hypothetical protein